MVRVGNLLFCTRNFIFPFACLLVLLPGPVILASDLAAAMLGLAVTLAGQLVRGGTIGLVYIIRGGRGRQVYAEDLVTQGVFAHCRNPMYVGNLLILSGMAITSNSWTCVLAAVPAAVFIYSAIVAAEEDYLRRKFGAEFEDYCARVPRFVPRLAGLRATAASLDFRWRRVVVKEYGTTFAWVVVWCAIVTLNLWRHGECATHPVTLRALAATATVAVAAWAAVRVLKKSRRLVAD